MQQIYRKTHMPKCDFNKVALQLDEITLLHGSSLVNLLHIFRTSFLKNISEGLLLAHSTTLFWISCMYFSYVIVNHAVWKKLIGMKSLTILWWFSETVFFLTLFVRGWLRESVSLIKVTFSVAVDKVAAKEARKNR